MTKSSPGRDRLLSRAYWERRLYRNSYTYRGRQCRVRGWSVKIQMHGTRRTLRLKSGNRSDAAAEALALYRRLLRSGWSGELVRRAPRETVKQAGKAPHLFAPRILEPVLRKYTDGLTPGLEQERFVELTHAGESHFVALGTNDVNAASRRAQELDRMLRTHDWNYLKLRHPWEFTVAVFWSADPMVCTYTTLLTIPGSGSGWSPARRNASANGWRVLIIEADPGIRRALARWLGESPGVRAVDAYADADAAARVIPQVTPDIALVNQRLAPGSLRHLRESWLQRQPRVRILEHGIYHNSDEIFTQVSGVARGYFLRRVKRTALLDPLLRSFPAGPPDPREADRQISRYFQQLLDPRPAGEVSTSPDLTARETQILELLRRGLVDKEIAGELGISVWTVHSHLKRMFNKLGVRRRAEAVARYVYK